VDALVTVRLGRPPAGVSTLARRRLHWKAGLMRGRLCGLGGSALRRIGGGGRERWAVTTGARSTSRAPTKRGEATGVSYRRLRASACLVAGSVVTCSGHRRMRPTGEARDWAAAHRGGKGLGLALGRGEWHRSDGCAQRTKLGTKKRYDGMHICAQTNKRYTCTCGLHR
jgi:hypothetical protein